MQPHAHFPSPAVTSAVIEARLWLISTFHFLSALCRTCANSKIQAFAFSCRHVRPDDSRIVLEIQEKARRDRQVPAAPTPTNKVQAEELIEMTADTRLPALRALTMTRRGVSGRLQPLTPNTGVCNRLARGN